MQRPGAVRWYRAFAASLVLTCVASWVVGALLVRHAPDLAADDPATSVAEIELYGYLLIAFGVAFVVPYTVAMLVPRRRWGWYVAIVTIAIGMTSCLWAVPAIFLLLAWLKPDVKAYFGFPPPPPAV